MSNRLAHETSPYLLQHKDNPVDWYPWGQEALQRARAENKPILLSIGYSACHWCHVMEHECFENPEIAAQMNQAFINIKVDREERPDLDHIYQNVAQAITHAGGWPLTVFLTPDLKPFFGGTYFPPEDRYGRPGFPKVLQALSEAYRVDRQGVEENATKLTEWIAAADPVVPRPDLPKTEKKFPEEVDFRSIAELLLERVDWQNGGFGDAPKFPNPMLLSFLWRFGCSKDHPKARESVILALRKMGAGGIFDQLGGGFHRYSVDASWSVPHFEKMLYDNALLLRLYSEVLLTGGEWLSIEDEDLFLEVLKCTKDYVLREMKTPEGPFFSAQDADSEGEEGKYFVWTRKEIETILPEKELAGFIHWFGVTTEGNFEQNNNVLIPKNNWKEFSESTKKPIPQLKAEVDSARKKLWEARRKRIAPGLDNKVLTSWNGLMISGLAWAGRVFDHYEMKQDARDALDSALAAFHFFAEKVSIDDGKLTSTVQGGVRKGYPYLDDYAFLAQGALDLARFYRTEKNQNKDEVSSLIEQAEVWLKRVLEDFSDSTGEIGFFFTGKDHEQLIHRPKALFDQAIPSGTAVALSAMVVLGALSPSKDTLHFNVSAETHLKGLFPVILGNPYGFGETLCALFLAKEGPVTVSGPGAEALCWHSHIFKGVQGVKAPGPESIQICYRQVCHRFDGLEEASAKIREILIDKASLS
ncbi:MAG: thioredoxin domain-containing protein [Bdellovibrio sp.]|nr:thioredoxin domain-containing protein [Bdellovibrio sp.]